VNCDVKWLIREARKAIPDNQALADALGIDRTTLWKWESKGAPIQVQAFCRLLEIVHKSSQ